MRLQGKVAIITGAAGSVGEAESRLFAREGASVVMADLPEQKEHGLSIAKAICADGGNAVFIQADVTTEQDWEALVSQTVARYGRLDILINNAGMSGRQFAKEAYSEGWQILMKVNADSCFLGTTRAVVEMRKGGGGAIVNTSSAYGVVGGGASHLGYHASKGAVLAYTKACACHYAKDNIRVNCVFPGSLPPMRSSGITIEQVQNNKGVTMAPQGRIGQPIEVAYAVLFLASDEASYITGAGLPVDGGFLAA